MCTNQRFIRIPRKIICPPDSKKGCYWTIQKSKPIQNGTEFFQHVTKDKVIIYPNNESDLTNISETEQSEIFIKKEETIQNEEKNAGPSLKRVEWDQLPANVQKYLLNNMKNEVSINMSEKIEDDSENSEETILGC